MSLKDIIGELEKIQEVEDLFEKHRRELDQFQDVIGRLSAMLEMEGVFEIESAYDLTKRPLKYCTPNDIIFEAIDVKARKKFDNWKKSYLVERRVND